MERILTIAFDVMVVANMDMSFSDVIICNYLVMRKLILLNRIRGSRSQDNLGKGRNSAFRLSKDMLK